MQSQFGIQEEPPAREDPIAPPAPAPAPALPLAQHPSSYTAANFPPPPPPPPSEGTAGETRGSPAATTHTLPHGYHAPHLQPSEAHIHPELRSGHEPALNSGYVPVSVPAMISAGVPPAPEQVHTMSGSPAVVSPGGGVIDHGEGGADGRKAKRELSQSKRAAQNRAAQRAFRQRKEGYIKKLEQQVRECEETESNWKIAQAENFALREYVISLQSRLIEVAGEYPPPPQSLHLALSQHPHPQAATGGPLGRAEPPAPAPAQPHPNPLEVAAQAVAGLSRSEHLTGRSADPYAGLRVLARSDDDVKTAEEITRQLQADGSQDALPEAAM
ncbi:putative transcription factor kapC [Cladorrhinum sp. PSN259]|nr:putative transcription factor kapC [Cladorrhinum sp. PSN259]